MPYLVAVSNEKFQSSLSDTATKYGIVHYATMFIMQPPTLKLRSFYVNALHRETGSVDEQRPEINSLLDSHSSLRILYSKQTARHDRRFFKVFYSCEYGSREYTPGIVPGCSVL